MRTGFEVKFKYWECDVCVGWYNNGRLAIQLVDSENGEPVAKATVNLPHVVLEEDEIAVKNWSENEGMLEALQNAYIVTGVNRTIPTGNTYALICTLTDDFKEELRRLQ